MTYVVGGGSHPCSASTASYRPQVCNARQRPACRFPAGRRPRAGAPERDRAGSLARAQHRLVAGPWDPLGAFAVNSYRPATVVPQSVATASKSAWPQGVCWTAAKGPLAMSYQDTTANTVGHLPRRARGGPTCRGTACGNPAGYRPTPLPPPHSRLCAVVPQALTPGPPTPMVHV